MKLKKLAFLIDLDNCLIDADSLKKATSDRFYTKLDKSHKADFEKIYESARTPSGLVDIPLVISRIAKKLGTKDFSKIGDIFYKDNFKKYLFKDTVPVLKKLKKLGDVNILSMGDKNFQELKIEKSGMGKIVGKSKQIIVTDKKEGIVNIIKEFKKRYENVVIIDDRADVLESAIKNEPSLVTVWINRGRYKNIKPDKSSSISMTAKSLTEIYGFMDKFVGKVNTQDGGFNLVAVKGITLLQRDQLIKYSNSDSAVKKFTRDSERFKSVSSFTNWLAKRKVIYTLIDHKQNLMGLIWFSKEKFPGYEYTFAIRLYGAARGKNIAKKFMEIVFSDFGSRKVWLKVLADNFIAIKLYKSFGFQNISAEDGSVVMGLGR